MKYDPYSEVRGKVVIWWFALENFKLVEYEHTAYKCSVNEAIEKAKRFGFKKPSLLNFWRYLIPAGFITVDGPGIGD